MTLSALIFDVDGTLAETEEAHREAFNAAFAARDLPWRWSIEAYRVLLRTTGGKERIKAFQALLPAPAVRLADDEVAELHRDKTRRYHEIIASGGLALRPGVDALVTTARVHGLALAVATTTSPSNVDALCRACWGRPADDVFDVIAAGDEVTAKKPAPDVYQLALERLGIGAERCLAFEDSRNGLIAARRADLRVVVCPSLYTADEDFTGAMWLVPSLEAFALPD